MVTRTTAPQRDYALGPFANQKRMMDRAHRPSTRRSGSSRASIEGKTTKISVGRSKLIFGHASNKVKNTPVTRNRVHTPVAANDIGRRESTLLEGKQGLNWKKIIPNLLDLIRGRICPPEDHEQDAPSENGTESTSSLTDESTPSDQLIISGDEVEVVEAFENIEDLQIPSATSEESNESTIIWDLDSLVFSPATSNDDADSDADSAKPGWWL